MKVNSIGILRWCGDTEEPVVLSFAANVAEFGYFQRGGMREFFTFVSRSLTKRVKSGTHVVDHEGYHVHIYAQPDGLVSVVLTDAEYPARVAMSLCRELLTGFVRANGDTWKAAREDNSMEYPPLEEALKEYQTPEKVDKIMRIHTTLGETKDVLVQTIDQVLARGEKLDDLVAKSGDLSDSSKLFYKQAKKTNSCCIVS